MISALSSVIDATEPEEARKIIETIADPLGTFYRFSMASSILRRVQMKNGKDNVK
jgi:F420-non-reducing hydrogenase small subunit